MALVEPHCSCQTEANCTVVISRVRPQAPLTRAVGVIHRVQSQGGWRHPGHWTQPASAATVLQVGDAHAHG